uniref:helix-turn-helix domain-containing protein n=1 Tax=uncultured Endozoicomonas sp. TaxID=432652 RepID=UPI002610F0CF
MNQNNHPAIKHKLGLLELADQLKNVSRACKVMGVSRKNHETPHPASTSDRYRVLIAAFFC